MKKNVLFIIFIVFTSCSIKEPIVDYIKGEKLEEIILIEEDEIPIEKSLVFINKQIKNGIVSKELIEAYKEMVGNSNSKISRWKKSDFIGHSNFEIVKIGGDFNIKNSYIVDGKKNFYSFSKPLYSDNKNIVSFFVSKSSGWNILFSGVVTMKKKNNAWEVIDLIEGTELY